MARARTPPKLLLALLYTLIFAVYVIQGSRTEVVVALRNHQRVYGFSPSIGELTQGNEKNKNYARRLMIGSTAPTCTYNECRGCKYKCRAEQVPVEGNDPINSAYHYRCVCHRRTYSCPDEYRAEVRVPVKPSRIRPFTYTRVMQRFEVQGCYNS